MNNTFLYNFEDQLPTNLPISEDRTVHFTYEILQSQNLLNKSINHSYG